MDYRYVILGGGVAAGNAAQEFVKQGIRPGELCLVSDDQLPPYNRPPLSKKYLKGEKSQSDILINPPSFYDEHGITTMLNTRIVEADLENRELYTAQGDTIRFGKLLIVTGSRLRKLDVPNAQLEGIHYLRYETDSRQIAKAMQNARRAVVVGGGYIGMEVGSVLASKGLQVTMVFPDERLMQRVFTPEMSDFFQHYYEARGVTIMTGEKAVGFSGTGRVSGVELASGRELPADLVVVGIGVTPALELFEDGDLHLENGIVVNKYLETNLPDIYAAGDVANYYDVIFQKYRRVEHWDNAVQQGKHAARMMVLDMLRDEYMVVPYFFSDIFDLSYEFWGDSEGTDQVVYRGDLDRGQFSVWWLTGDRLDAAFVMNRPDEERDLAPEWIRMRQRVDVDYLRNETRLLAEMPGQRA